jgi:DNA-binding transcriptional LysR family regulator
VRPTPAGALVVARAARVLAGVDGLAEDLAGLDDADIGAVIAALRAAATTLT